MLHVVLASLLLWVHGPRLRCYVVLGAVFALRREIFEVGLVVLEQAIGLDGGLASVCNLLSKDLDVRLSLLHKLLVLLNLALDARDHLIERCVRHGLAPLFPTFYEKHLPVTHIVFRSN